LKRRWSRAGWCSLPRGLDHIVHAVRDLDAAAEFYRRMGFTIGARNRHSWGTHNHVVQLPGFFIELLTVAEPEKLGEDDISRLFGRFNQSFIEQGDGFSMLLLESKDADGDVEAFRQAGIAASDKKSHFEREAKGPDGAPIKVGFSLAFAEDKCAPSVHFATCQQHHPQNFWNPAFQTHANGVKNIRGVVMVAGDVGAHSKFIAALTGVDAANFHKADGEISAATPRGTLSVMSPKRFELMFGAPAANASQVGRLAAVRFEVGDVAKTGRFFGKAALPHRSYDGGLVIDASDALGACMSFEPRASV
jgi:catechol 2,3-dioxygenase-like lactoylglutathione lyase family enzyme